MHASRTFSMALLAAGFLLFSVNDSWAVVTVTFTKPESFSDMPRSSAEKNQVLQSLKEHLVKLGARLPSDNDLTLEITDIDLAGEFVPGARQINDVRILKGKADWPSMRFRYSLESKGKLIQSGDESIANMDYLRHINPYPSGDSLRYEKQMLDEWFSKKFPAQAR